MVTILLSQPASQLLSLAASLDLCLPSHSCGHSLNLSITKNCCLITSQLWNSLSLMTTLSPSVSPVLPLLPSPCPLSHAFHDLQSTDCVTFCNALSSLLSPIASIYCLNSAVASFNSALSFTLAPLSKQPLRPSNHQPWLIPSIYYLCLYSHTAECLWRKTEEFADFLH